MTAKQRPVNVRWLGRRSYLPVLRSMREFTEARTQHSLDEIWLLEHLRVITLGQAGDRSHVRTPVPAPVIRSDRGGEVTYHGPGQLVVYLLLDLRRMGVGVRSTVNAIEAAVIGWLAAHGAEGGRRDGAPGVYAGGSKIASVGLRVRNGCTFHGLSVNVDTGPEAFRGIDPCGYVGLAVTSLAALGVGRSLRSAGSELVAHLAGELSLVPVPEPASPPEPAARAARAGAR